MNDNNDLKTGIKINADDKTVVIKGNKSELIELADYIVSVATSKNDIDHLHLDSLTLLDSNSNISELIIEKE